MTLDHELPCLPGHLEFLKSQTPVDFVSGVLFLSSCAKKPLQLSPASFLPPPPSQAPSSAKGTSNGAFSGVSAKTHFFRENI